MWFTYSLLTMFAWGIDSLFQKLGSDPRDKQSHWKVTMYVGFAFGIHAVCYMLYKGISYDPINMIKYLPVSLCYIVSMTLSYVGLRYLELSVLNPIANSSGAVTAVLCVIFLDQKMSGIQIAAVVMICVGIAALSFLENQHDKELRAREGTVVDSKYVYSALALMFPLMYLILDGVGSFADAFYLNKVLSEADALLSYEFTFLLVAICSFIWVKFIRKSKFVFADDKWKAGAAVLETAGQFFYVFAMAENAVVAAPMIAAYCVVALVLSPWVIKERLSLKQYIAIAFVVVGIVILGIE